MKRRFTGGRQTKGQSKGSQKSHQGTGGAPQKGKSSDEKAEVDRSRRPFSSSRKDDDDGPSKSSRRSKKVIKNARSLADVVGGGKASGPSRFSGRGGGAGGPVRPRGDSVPDRSSGTGGGKLTFITSFQEPKKETPATPPAPKFQRSEIPVEKKTNSNPRPAPTPAQVKQPAGKTQASAPQSQSRQANSRQQNSRQEPRTTGDFSWPKERHKEVPKAEPTERRGRTQRDGARVVSGFVKRHPDGFGFLIPDDREIPDVYISRQSMMGVMTNDRVEVEIYRPRSAGKGKEDRLSGEIARIASRANRRVVGRYLPVDKKYGVILDENKGWGSDLRIAATDSMDAKEGDMVAVEIIQYPEHNKEFTGRVVSLLGDVDDPINDVIRIVHEAGIPNEFSKEAIADAEHFGGKVTDAERRGREDLTELNLITIDGATARDFDDAIYTEETAEGFRLVVAIADVSHYVKPGTRLDNEAYDRGTSTYFPNFVVPMLPEALSNDLCSLNPHVPRLCFCCEMKIDRDGEIDKFRFFEGVMISKSRVTYGQAQEVLDAHADGAAASSYTAAVKKFEHVTDTILRSADLAKILMAKRFREGSLDLEIPETQVVVDSTGETVDIIRSERLFAHRLIEELMLVTNICTARFLDQAQLPGIYRIHEEPDPDAIRSLQRYLWNLGGTKSVMGGKLAKKLTEALEAMRDRPEGQILNILTLRTMQQAKYSPVNVGHFGLGFSHYSHFTSPIRRYPDLIAHRLIKSELSEKYESMRMGEDELASATTWLSACEQRSVKAERKVISIKKARFIRKFVGDEFDGIISSVTKFGVFVLLRQYDVDGLIKIENLGNDRFEFDMENLKLVGSRSGLTYAIGDAVHVKVMSADPETGKVDFQLTNLPEVKETEAKGKRKKEQTRGSSHDHQQAQGSEKGRDGVPKRGKAKNNSRRVRKERVSKRR